MNIHFRYEDGTPVPGNVCIRRLASRTRLTVVIDSIGHLSPDAIMRHLKKQWGCHEVTIEEEVVTCKGYTVSAPPFKSQEP